MCSELIHGMHTQKNYSTVTVKHDDDDDDYQYYYYYFIILGIPLVIVSLVLAIDKDAYGNNLSGKSTFQLQAAEQL